MAILTLLNDPNPGEEEPVAPVPQPMVETSGKKEETEGAILCHNNSLDDEIAVDDEFEYVDERLVGIMNKAMI